MPLLSALEQMAETVWLAIGAATAFVLLGAVVNAGVLLARRLRGRIDLGAGRPGG